MSEDCSCQKIGERVRALEVAVETAAKQPELIRTHWISTLATILAFLSLVISGFTMVITFLRHA